MFKKPILVSDVPPRQKPVYNSNWDHMVSFSEESHHESSPCCACLLGQEKKTHRLPVFTYNYLQSQWANEYSNSTTQFCVYQNPSNIRPQPITTSTCSKLAINNCLPVSKLYFHYILPHPPCMHCQQLLQQAGPQRLVSKQYYWLRLAGRLMRCKVPHNFTLGKVFSLFSCTLWNSIFSEKNVPFSSASCYPDDSYFWQYFFNTSISSKSAHCTGIWSFVLIHQTDNCTLCTAPVQEMPCCCCCIPSSQAESGNIWLKGECSCNLTIVSCALKSEKLPITQL